MYVKQETVNTIVIEKSRFITYLKPVKDEQGYKDYLKEIKKKHYDRFTQFNELLAPEALVLEAVYTVLAVSEQDDKRTDRRGREILRHPRGVGQEAGLLAVRARTCAVRRDCKRCGRYCAVGDAQMPVPHCAGVWHGI